MFSDLELVSKLFTEEKGAGWFFNEVAFDEEAIAEFSKLPLDLELLEHSAKLKTSSDNHAYLPCHYFLYALKVRPFALMLHEYVNLKEQVVSSLTGNNKAKASALQALVTSPSPSNTITNALDTYSQNNFFNFFKNGDKRLGAKEPINSGRGVIRTDIDIFGSIMLKALPVPDDSSNALGRLIYAFSKSSQIYDFLVNKYASSLPYLFKSENGDELLYLIFITLGLEGHFDTILKGTIGTTRIFSIGVVADALLLNTTPVSGNPSYFDTPIHCSTSTSTASKVYVFFKKGLLDDEATLKELSNHVSSFWPYALIDKSEEVFYLKPVPKVNTPRLEVGCNKIIYGAPGTGKSHQIHTVECLGAEKVVTVFHPDTQYNDFVGALKPMMKIDIDGNSTVTYQFRPGPFTNALVKAKRSPSTHVCLIIEEINRAPAAAVFGELFQLLDRNATGESTYKIDAADPDMLLYINEQLRTSGVPELTQLEIPANLSILATMNSSDQAVMPLDTAFKRRWSFEYLEIDFSNSAVPQTEIDVSTGNGKYTIKWPDLAKAINDVLIGTGIAEDRLIGPFFLNSKELINPSSAKDALNGKLFVYLWDDVLRHIGTHKIFDSSYKTFGGLSSAFKMGLPVFSAAIEKGIEDKGEIVEVPEAGQDAGE